MQQPYNTTTTTIQNITNKKLYLYSPFHTGKAAQSALQQKLQNNTNNNSTTTTTTTTTTNNNNIKY